MTDPANRLPEHVWSGLISNDPASEVGVLGVPFDGAVSFLAGAGPRPSSAICHHTCPLALRKGNP